MIDLTDPGLLPVLALLGAAVFIVFPIVVLSSNEAKPIADLQSKLGLDSVWPPVLFIGAALWAVVFGLLVVGLLSVIWEIIQGVYWQSTDGDMSNSGRFALVRLTAITATTGAVIAFPLTLIKVKLTRDANETSDETLFNEKINTATEDLHAMRQRWDGEQNIWEDDIVRRNAAIDRLEGLVVERPDTAARVSRLLSVYVRVLSRDMPARNPPKDVDIIELHRWELTLRMPRSDMENAVQALGRMKRISNVKPGSVTIDLRNANLQAFDLKNLDLSHAQMQSAKLQGANLAGSVLTNINLRSAGLQVTGLENAMMQGANLRLAMADGARLENANLKDANLSSISIQHASLANAQLRRANLSAAVVKNAEFRKADLSEANLSFVDFSSARIEDEQIVSGFGVSRTTLKDGRGTDSPGWPSHWPKTDPSFFHTDKGWKRWLADPHNYTPPPAP
ncbi:pentapeptide repeat-containing protein [Phaeobacter sp.]|uniref:pentapeptide repeat-containing protein n=1 Tax=Phaeobacter sp. TaxID=1902409 RepID=UPI0025D4BEC9|nr:pentapeptide repeat-containing protein [Phaeobacter sp.]